MIELHGVRRSYSPQRRERIVALDLPSLRLDEGGCLVVTGANGTGKTTLLHLVAGLLRPDEGSVRVAGTDLGELGEAALDRFRARHVGYLLQGAQLLEPLTAEENLLAAMLFAGRRARGGRERAHALLEQLGVAHRARHRPWELSGGERQKVGLARALVNDPPLLLADEPFAGLDPASVEGIAAELQRQVLEHGRTLVVVSHQGTFEGAEELVLPVGAETGP